MMNMNNRDMSSEELVLLGQSELRRLEAQILDTLEHIEECGCEDECNELIEELNDLYERLDAALDIDYI